MLRLILAASLTAWIAGCAKADDPATPTTATPTPTTDSDDEEDSAEADLPQPGSILLALDGAMGSIAFAGQAGDSGSSLADNDWIDEHCEETGDGTKSAYQGEVDVVWGCLLAVKTDGPDTPRGGVNRVKQVSCSIDEAIEDGVFEVDGTAHEFEMLMSDDCWGEAFVEMVAEEMPDTLNADGRPEISMTVTGYEEVPAAWSENPSDWDVGYEIIFGFGSDDTTTYRMLLRSDDSFLAASILSSSSDEEDSEVFAMSIEFEGGEEDLATFRYEGRFPYGAWGDGSGYGSRHTRVIVAGPYAGEGGFESIDSGEGYEAGMSGSASTLTSGSVSSFAANEDGLGTKYWSLDATGAPSTTSEDGVAGINEFEYSGSADELPGFLTSDLDDTFTDAETWQFENGPLSYATITVSD